MWPELPGMVRGGSSVYAGNESVRLMSPTIGSAEVDGGGLAEVSTAQPRSRPAGHCSARVSISAAGGDEERPAVGQAAHRHERARIDCAQPLGDAFAMRAHQARRQQRIGLEVGQLLQLDGGPEIVADARHALADVARHRVVATPARRGADREHAGDAEPATAEDERERTPAGAREQRRSAQDDCEDADAEAAADADAAPALPGAQPPAGGADEGANVCAGRTRALLCGRHAEPHASAISAKLLTRLILSRKKPRKEVAVPA